ncbi:hypothetical protein, partial [Escherichia coli]|uniref:hypothetical protein n=1 Tax=Escherichia coli TaxID=562 RepID=UPI001F36974F
MLKRCAKVTISQQGEASVQCLEPQGVPIVLTFQTPIAIRIVTVGRLTVHNVCDECYQQWLALV